MPFKRVPTDFDVVDSDSLMATGDLLDVGVLSLGPDFTIRGWNHWLEAATGWSANEVVGKSLLGVFPEITGTTAEQALTRAATGETIVLAHRFHRWLLPIPSGPAFPEFDRMQQSARIAPIMAEDRVDGIIAIIQDVTERVAREDELRAAIEEAQTASNAKSEFLAAMSHELRTPLGAIIGYAELVETEVVGPLQELQKTHMRRIKAGAWHLLSIIEQILTFSRVEAGKEEIHLEKLNVCALLDEAIALIKPQASEKGLRVLVTYPPNELTLESDPGKVRQILVNLLGNAVKFTTEGEIELRVWKDEPLMYFQVRDTGQGIPNSHLQRVFEPFTQISQAGRPHGGTGLGLPVSRRFAQMLGGDLEVESVVGEGSQFTLRIPLSPLRSSADWSEGGQSINGEAPARK